MDYPKAPPSSYVDPRDYKGQQVQEFLRKIGILESTSGQNTNHPEMTSGLHVGTSATGDYGLMPKTAQDIDRNAGTDYLQGLSPEEAQQVLENNPELSKTLAETMASKLLQKNQPDVAAYKWLYGQYTNPSKQQLERSDRVKKFRSLDKMGK